MHDDTQPPSLTSPEASGVPPAEAIPAFSPPPGTGILDRVLALHQRYGPWIALATGVATTMLLRRGVSFVPIAVFCLLACWGMTAAISRWLHPVPSEGRFRVLVRLTGESVIAGFYQDGVFFIIPIWFGSSVLFSRHLGMLAVLAGMALLTCFEYHLRAWVLGRPWPRAIFSATLLFLTLGPAFPALARVPVWASLALSAGLSCLAVAIAVVPHPAWRERRTWIGLGAALALTMAGVVVLAPMLPAAPLQVVDSATTAAILERQPVSEAGTFEEGVGRVYGWFAIAAPTRYEQEVVFRWYRDGEPWGREFHTRITGGREQGWRTWSYVTRPPPGRWRVDVITAGGQLLGRETFRVRRAPGG